MNPQEALKLVSQAARSIQANAEVHDKIREALSIISSELSKSDDA